MTVISSKDFRSRQSHYLNLVRSGEHVALRLPHGTYQLTLTPVEDEELAQDVHTKQPVKDEREYVMSSQELTNILREGEMEIAEGNFTPIAIEDLWK